MQSRKLIARSLRQHFDAAVMIVTHPSRDAEHVRLALDKPTETDTLDTSANDEAAGLDRLFRRSHVSNSIADCRFQTAVKAANVRVQVASI